jgi:hypothetical protein
MLSSYMRRMPLLILRTCADYPISCHNCVHLYPILHHFISDLWMNSHQQDLRYVTRFWLPLNILFTLRHSLIVFWIGRNGFEISILFNPIFKNKLMSSCSHVQHINLFCLFVLGFGKMGLGPAEEYYSPCTHIYR